MIDEEQAGAEQQAPTGGEDATTDSPPEAQPEKSQDQPEQQAPPEPQDATKLASEEAPEAEEAEQKRIRRGDRRIHQLLDKLQGQEERAQPVTPAGGQTNTVSDVLGLGQTPPWWQKPEEQSPLFQPGAEVSPEQLEQEINRRAATAAELKVRQVLSEYEQNNHYTRTVETFTNELEQVSQASEFTDPTFDKKFTKLYQRANFDGDRFTGRVPASEIYQDLKEEREHGRTSGQKETTVKMAEAAAQQAVTPTSGTSDRQSSELESLRQNAIEDGSNEAWAEYLKRVLAKKP